MISLYRKPFLLQGLLCVRAHSPFPISFLSRHCEGQACFFQSSTYPQTLLSTQEGRVFNQRLKQNLPLGARRVPLGQRSPCFWRATSWWGWGLSFAPRAPFVPGDALPTRYVEEKCCPPSRAASVGFGSRTIALEERGAGAGEHRWAQRTHSLDIPGEVRAGYAGSRAFFL